MLSIMRGTDAYLAVSAGLPPLTHAARHDHPFMFVLFFLSLSFALFSPLLFLSAGDVFIIIQPVFVVKLLLCGTHSLCG